MKYTAALLAGGAASVAHASAFCANAVQDTIGNYYCPGAVAQIKYTGLDIPGKYRKVASMDNSGLCIFEDQTYSGPIAPYDEDLSLQFRGPMVLSNVAVYHPTSSNSKRNTPRTSQSKRHGHQHKHLHKKHDQHIEEKRADMVTAVIDGITQTWENDWFGGAATSTNLDQPSIPTTEAAATPTVAAAETTPGAQPSSSQSSSSDASNTQATEASDFERTAYYCAQDGTADGLVFLANVGTDGVSGTFDNVWGSSLGYVDENGAAAASSPTVLQKRQLASNQEIAIYSDKECTNGDCGATRPKSVAYKGFAGATKIFVVEFTMPDTGETADGKNMPAFWINNGAIGRTGQYTSCNCWAGDNESPLQGSCGEFDVVEILTPGETRAKSTFHFAAGTGDSHYFDRPVNAPMTVAVVFDAASSTVSIKFLDSFDWSTSLTSDQVNAMISDESDVSKLSLMTFGR